MSAPSLVERYDNVCDQGYTILASATIIFFVLTGASAPLLQTQWDMVFAWGVVVTFGALGTLIVFWALGLLGRLAIYLTFKR